MSSVVNSATQLISRLCLRSRSGDVPLPTDPVTFKILDELLAEMAKHLLIGVCRHVLSKKVQRLGSNAHRLPVCASAHQTRPDHASDTSLDRSVDLRRRDNFIHEPPGFRRVNMERPVKKDGLPGKSLANEAGEPQVRRRRNDALFPGWQTEIRSSLGENIINHEQKLAPASDSKGFDGGNPGLLERLLGFIIGFCQAAYLVRVQNPAIHLVRKPHVSDQVLQI